MNYFTLRLYYNSNINRTQFKKNKVKQQKNTLVLIIICLMSISLKGQNVSNEKLFLDGTWDIIFDDKNEGISNKWFLNSNYLQQNHQKITVPSCWETTKKDYEGVGIYRTLFKVPKNWTKQIVELNFKASNYKTEVWINDQVVGFHEGGYTPFKFRIDNLIKPGEENSLIVRVVSPIILTDKNIDGLGRQEVPMWRGALTGGIWQSVFLEAKGSLLIKDVFIEPKITNNSTLINLDVKNSETYNQEGEILISIFSKDGEVVSQKKELRKFQPGKTSLKYNLNIPNAIYWDTQNPYLYNVSVTIKLKNSKSDYWTHKFGMREFTIRDNQFYLNNKPLYLKAAFFEGLYPVGQAYPDSREMAIKEISLAKDAGFNMIRPWRKPAPQMWLDLCDEMGILTVGSLAVECMRRPISTPRLPFVVENELRKTISTNRNRTSIVQWELFNEINRPILAQMLNSMSILARELDPTRMILDESGGWGEGANIYLPYQKTPIKFNDIHHYSGSQVNESEFDGYLVTAKTKDQKKKLGLKDLKGYGKNVVPGMMSYVSELGYGSTPDLPSNIKEFEEKGNPITAPYIYHKELDEGYKNALKITGFNKIYPNTQTLYKEQQKMHGIANKRMIEATRLNSTIAGYCVHALVGGDWVLGAGLLDLWRYPKTLVYDMTKEANQPQITPIRVLPRNVYAEKGTRIEIHGVNELNEEEIKVSISITSIEGKSIYQKTFNKEFKSGISKLFTTQLDTKELKGNYSVNVEVKNSKGKVITTNSQAFDVFTKKQLTSSNTKVAIVDIDESLATFLSEKNIPFEHFSSSTKTSIPVLVGKANKQDKFYKQKVSEVLNFIKKGGKATFLQIQGNRIKGFNRVLNNVTTNNPLEMEVQQKWATLGGWAAKSHIVSKHPIFNGLPTNEIMQGVYENIHPHTTLSKLEGNYIAGSISYDHFPNHDVMRRHYNGPGEVWWSADVLEKKVGKGTLLVSTLRILEYLGKDPVAEKVLFNMINYMDK